MKLLICTVEGEPACLADSQKRIAALAALLDESGREEIDLVLLPAGYFFSSKSPEAWPEWAAVNTLVERRGIGVCFGIDTRGQKSSVKAKKKLTSTGKLPSFGLGWTYTDGWQGPWRQRSANSRDQHLVPEALSQEGRFLHVRGKRLSILLCGELFNRRIREAVANSDSFAVLNMVHRGRGYRFHAAAPRWSSGSYSGAVLMSAHVKRRQAAKRMVINGEYISTRECDICISVPLRIEGKQLSI